MSIVENINTLRDWMEENVCSRIHLKLPDDNAVGDTYPYKLVTPAAFCIYYPGKDRMPPNVAAPIPSVCVELMEGADDLIAHKGEMRIRLSFSAWNPGTHGPDIIEAAGNVTGRVVHEDESGKLEAIVDFNTKAETFIRNADGWMDAWNFVDLALRELENNEYLGGLRIKKEEPITFGPFSEQNAIVDFYPYWFAWISFTIERGVVRTQAQYNDHL